jgi:signal transduction histidine kinase
MMSMNRLGMSRLAKEAGFGTRIWSESGYWGGRFYNLIVAGATAIILIISLYQHVSVQILASVLLIYGLYLVLRFYFIARHEVAYYRPLVQFWRAQLFIIGLTLLIAWLGWPEVHGYLWLLYSLQLMIIGRHLSTSVFLASILEVWALLAALHWWAEPTTSSWVTFLQNPDLISQWTWITLIGFVVHYLLRNIDARDETITTLNRINALVGQQQPGREAEPDWQKVLDTYLAQVGGRTASIWLYNHHTDKTRLLTRLDHCLGNACPIFSLNDRSQPLVQDLNRALARVVRTGQPVYCRAQGALGDLLVRANDPVHICPLPHGIHSSLLIPIKEPTAEAQPMLGILCVDFGRATPPREHLLPHYFEFLSDLAQRIAPSLRSLQRVEEQWVLRQAGVRVSSSLRLEEVLNDTLDVLTGPLGFELATISLVDEEAQLIRCVAGRNVSPSWINLAYHALSSDDIQADVVRRGQAEVIRGWDRRFDNRIYGRFNHHQLIRAFVPIPRQSEANGQTPKAQGVVEVGYSLDTRDTITPGQLTMLTTFVDQAAVAIEKARLFEDMLQHRELLAQLHQVSHDLAGAGQPDEVLTDLGEALLSVLKADIVMFYRFNRTSQAIEPPQIFGEVWGRRPIQLASPNRGIVAEILHQDQPYYAPDVANDPLLTEPQPAQGQGKNRGRTFTKRQNIKSFAGIPMFATGETVGVLCINYRRRHAFAENERLILGLAAQLAAVALRNAEFNALSADLAVTEERSRLAGQLHDSVSQYLPAIQLMADTALTQLPSYPEQTAHWLERIRLVAQQTITEIRVNLFELSVSTTRSRNLRQALIESATLAREYFSMEVDIIPQAIPETLRIPIEAELLLVCREAIVNATRHAHARHVRVELAEVDGHVRLQVQDDGCGFDLNALSRSGLRGLKLMRQRVERMGGELNIQSQPGQGTTIEVTVPT